MNLSCYCHRNAYPLSCLLFFLYRVVTERQMAHVSLFFLTGLSNTKFYLLVYNCFLVDLSIYRKIGLQKSPPPFSISSGFKWQPTLWHLILATTTMTEGTPLACHFPTHQLSCSQYVISSCLYFAAISHVDVLTWIPRMVFKMLFLPDFVWCHAFNPYHCLEANFDF